MMRVVGDTSIDTEVKVDPHLLPSFLHLKAGKVPSDPEQGGHDETRDYPRRAALNLFGEVEGADIGRHPTRRHDLCLGFSPFDPATGEVVDAPVERQTELVEQMKLCLETAGASLDDVLKCNVYCTSVEKFAAVNAVYARYFRKDPPARIFVNVPAWPGRFDIEIDCIAVS
jgi:2-iminobutanoate/2-iminopropanoate deaminase